MRGMAWPASVFLIALGAPALAVQVQSVYLLPMSNGLDQFVASRLAASGALHVVADPQKADAVLTDHLGEGFEQRLTELLDLGEAKAKKEEKDKDKAQRFTSFGRGKGTIFLVDARTRLVIWSSYHKPKNSSPDELNRAAGRIVARLKKDLQPKP